MDNKNEKFLPIGSVVLLKGGTKKAMVTGFCSVVAEDKTKMYDYTGCVYPEGYIDFNQICLFDHEQIEKVFHYGYVDEEETEFKKELEEISMQYKNGDEEIIRIVDEIDSEGDDDDEVDNSSEEKNIIENRDEKEETDHEIIPKIEIANPKIENSSNDTIEQLEYL
ncbi:MAG: DUF4176 domain-containing protein [Bacilli bacterium]|nr:DUF4176 domain-containing protein [Bacilli bacterium]